MWKSRKKIYGYKMCKAKSNWMMAPFAFSIKLADACSIIVDSSARSLSFSSSQVPDNNDVQQLPRSTEYNHCNESKRRQRSKSPSRRSKTDSKSHTQSKHSSPADFKSGSPKEQILINIKSILEVSKVPESVKSKPETLTTSTTRQQKFAWSGPEQPTSGERESVSRNPADPVSDSLHSSSAEFIQSNPEALITVRPFVSSKQKVPIGVQDESVPSGQTVLSEKKLESCSSSKPKLCVGQPEVLTAEHEPSIQSLMQGWRTKELQCFYCPELDFTSKNQLMKHLTRRHFDLVTRYCNISFKADKCLLCGDPFKDYDKLMDHLKNHKCRRLKNNPNLIEDMEEEFYINYRNQLYSNAVGNDSDILSDVQNDIGITQAENESRNLPALNDVSQDSTSFKCYQCGKCFPATSSYELELHVVANHIEKRFRDKFDVVERKCRLCGMQFSEEFFNHLASHLQTCEGPKLPGRVTHRPVWKPQPELPELEVFKEKSNFRDTYSRREDFCWDTAYHNDSLKNAVNGSTDSFDEQWSNSQGNSRPNFELRSSEIGETTIHNERNLTRWDSITPHSPNFQSLGNREIDVNSKSQEPLWNGLKYQVDLNTLLVKPTIRQEKFESSFETPSRTSTSSMVEIPPEISTINPDSLVSNQYHTAAPKNQQTSSNPNFRSLRIPKIPSAAQKHPNNQENFVLGSLSRNWSNQAEVNLASSASKNLDPTTWQEISTTIPNISASQSLEDSRSKEPYFSARNGRNVNVNHWAKTNLTTSASRHLEHTTRPEISTRVPNISAPISMKNNENSTKKYQEPCASNNLEKSVNPGINPNRTMKNFETLTFKDADNSTTKSLESAKNLNTSAPKTVENFSKPGVSSRISKIPSSRSLETSVLKKPEIPTYSKISTPKDSYLNLHETSARRYPSVISGLKIPKMDKISDSRNPEIPACQNPQVGDSDSSSPSATFKKPSVIVKEAVNNFNTMSHSAYKSTVEIKQRTHKSIQSLTENHLKSHQVEKSIKDFLSQKYQGKNTQTVEKATDGKRKSSGSDEPPESNIPLKKRLLIRNKQRMHQEYLSGATQPTQCTYGGKGIKDHRLVSKNNNGPRRLERIISKDKERFLLSKTRTEQQINKSTSIEIGKDGPEKSTTSSTTEFNVSGNMTNHLKDLTQTYSSNSNNNQQDEEQFPNSLIHHSSRKFSKSSLENSSTSSSGFSSKQTPDDESVPISFHIPSTSSRKSNYKTSERPKKADSVDRKVPKPEKKATPSKARRARTSELFSGFRKLDPNQIYKKLLKCHCGSKHETPQITNQCLHRLGLDICYLCLAVVPNRCKSIRNHNRKAGHFVGCKNQKVLCPFTDCMKILDYKRGIKNHLTRMHFPRIEPQGLIQNVYEKIRSQNPVKVSKPKSKRRYEADDSYDEESGNETDSECSESSENEESYAKKEVCKPVEAPPIRAAAFKASKRIRRQAIIMNNFEKKANNDSEDYKLRIENSKSIFSNSKKSPTPEKNRRVDGTNTTRTKDKCVPESGFGAALTSFAAGFSSSSSVHKNRNKEMTTAGSDTKPTSQPFQVSWGSRTNLVPPASKAPKNKIPNKRQRSTVDSKMVSQMKEIFGADITDDEEGSSSGDSSTAAASSSESEVDSNSNTTGSFTNSSAIATYVAPRGPEPTEIPIPLTPQPMLYLVHTIPVAYGKDGKLVRINDPGGVNTVTAGQKDIYPD